MVRVASSAPLLIGGGIALLVWGFVAGGGVGNVFATSAELQTGQAPFWAIFWPSLAANVGYWITLSLNIPDFTRYAQSQRSQIIGQAIGLPLTMTAFSFIGIAVTAATIVVFGEAIWDPVQLVTQLTGDIPALLILAMFVIAIAQISTNMAANVVSPSFDFSNLAPKFISFRMGGLITAVIGVLSFPWVLLETAGAYIFTWLVGYGSLLGAIGAVMIADYWIIRRRQLSLADLYKHDGLYAYSGGWNWRAIVAVLIGVCPVLPGFFKAATTPGFAGVFENPSFIEGLYNYGLFFTFFVAGISYLLLSTIPGLAPQAAPGARDHLGSIGAGRIHLRPLRRRLAGARRWCRARRSSTSSPAAWRGGGRLDWSPCSGSARAASSTSSSPPSGSRPSWPPRRPPSRSSSGSAWRTCSTLACNASSPAMRRAAR